MENIFTSLNQLVGRTPLLELAQLEAREGLSARLLAKLEWFNPAGSVKDRAALAMLDAAFAQGLLSPGGVIIEPTSGNTGIALAALGASRGCRVILVMPETMSRERRQLMEAYGARVVLTPGPEGMEGAVRQAEALAAELPGSFLPHQFRNPANSRAHRDTTGPELWEATQGHVDIFAAGVGTGGTLTGVGEYLKSRWKGVQVVAVEPADSPLLSRGISRSHGLQGIGANFLPELFNRAICDEILPVAQDAAEEACRLAARTEGLLIGISSGAALHAAVVLARRRENRGKTIVTLFPDSGERYLSTGLFG